MSEILCVADPCTVPGRHQTACPGEDCRGCLPGLAADGRYLCGHHERRLGSDVAELPALYDALALRLAATGMGGERTSGTPTRSPGINDAAVEARTVVRHTVVSWCLLVAEERGVTLPGRWTVVELPLGVEGPLQRVQVPDETMAALVAWLGKHVPWLAAQRFGGEACDEFRALAHGHPRSVAYPNGTRSFNVADCPVEECPGKVRAVLRRTDALLPSELVCTEDEGHTWPASAWLTLGRQLARRAA
jgi:hypothetical protein